MRKNKIIDFVFGIIAVAAVGASMTGCSNASYETFDSYTPAATQEAVVDQTAEIVTDEEPTVDKAVAEKTEVTVDTEVVSEVEDSEPEVDFLNPASIEAIKEVCDLKALCETDYDAGAYDCNGEHPYGPVYDFGADWDNYVAMCDWSLVFDADYYAAEFPFLALEYHNDADELLFHFQTVGVHEGRQGSADFNIGAYALNSGLDRVFGENLGSLLSLLYAEL